MKQERLGRVHAGDIVKQEYPAPAGLSSFRQAGDYHTNDFIGKAMQTDKILAQTSAAGAPKRSFQAQQVCPLYTATSKWPSDQSIVCVSMKCFR
ncbi:hypothetical protein BJV78DRAFT_1177467 [Lactifluus subvellereus]|nr:hypothetical protein BJV78DRAFT_1177467 [Lactifluus subvellereus]